MTDSGSTTQRLSRELRLQMLKDLAKATFATGPRQTDTTFYEFRTYTIKPCKMSEFTKHTNENFHFRTIHSELIGYFTMELGALNKVFSIWKYGNFAERTAIRAKLAQDKDFMEKYLAKALTMIDKQDSEIAYLVPWCKLDKPEKTGVYELVTFQFKPGGPAVWGDAFRAAISTHVHTGYTKLVGVFNTEYGLLNQALLVWRVECDYFRSLTSRHFAVSYLCPGSAYLTASSQLLPPASFLLQLARRLTQKCSFEL
ncbi:Hypothetical predicted protein [Pelobates cultripes]|uniref:NIPSNAP domain-containing protein n=1 Tax=Pelobates cultripes TaxID=61616 RepID=A0AAD1S062_PELCU|nr:Hypothetical predicted protein [Pelobates cultripes]